MESRNIIISIHNLYGILVCNLCDETEHFLYLICGCQRNHYHYNCLSHRSEEMKQMMRVNQQSLCVHHSLLLVVKTTTYVYACEGMKKMKQQIGISMIYHRQQAFGKKNLLYGPAAKLQSVFFYFMLTTCFENMRELFF